MPESATFLLATMNRATGRVVTSGPSDCRVFGTIASDVAQDMRTFRRIQQMFEPRNVVLNLANALQRYKRTNP